MEFKILETGTVLVKHNKKDNITSFQDVLQDFTDAGNFLSGLMKKVENEKYEKEINENFNNIQEFETFSIFEKVDIKKIKILDLK